jgi:hypothetical protein
VGLLRTCSLSSTSDQAGPIYHTWHCISDHKGRPLALLALLVFPVTERRNYLRNDKREWESWRLLWTPRICLDSICVPTTHCLEEGKLFWFFSAPSKSYYPLQWEPTNVSSPLHWRIQLSSQKKWKSPKNGVIWGSGKEFSQKLLSNVIFSNVASESCCQEGNDIISGWQLLISIKIQWPPNYRNSMSTNTNITPEL